MTIDAAKLQDRTKKQCLSIFGLVQQLPVSLEAQVMGKQLIRSATSVAANYRSACVARSRSEFVAKLWIVVEEADETLLWLELIHDSGISKHKGLSGILQEARELLYIFSASRKTAKDKLTK